MIESSHNPLVKQLRSLRSRGGRQKAGLFLLEGIRLVEAALDAGVSVKQAVYSPGLRDNQRGLVCLERIAAFGCQPQLISGSLFRSLADTEHPQGLIVAAVLPPDAELTEADFADLSRLLIVDGVQDPGNLGTIIRTADALGVQMVLTLAGTVDAFNQKVVRSAMGSLFHVRLRQGHQFSSVLPILRRAGLQLVVSSLSDAVPYTKASYGERVALVVGNEGAGVSAELLQAADLRVNIPIVGQAESLNVAVATGIILAKLGQA